MYKKLCVLGRWFVRSFVCLFVCLFVCVFVCVSICVYVVCFIFLVLFLPATFFLNHFGLKRGVLVSASINAIGGVLRYFFATGISFGGCVFAQSLCGVSQVLNFCCVGALASSVVKPEFKSRAIGLIWFSTYFGCALGLWIPPMAIGDASSDLLPCLLGVVRSFLNLVLDFEVSIHVDSVFPPPYPNAAEYSLDTLVLLPFVLLFLL